MPDSLACSKDNAVAIIGMAGRFPGAVDVESYWDLIVEGREGLRDFPDEELLANGVSPEELAKPTYVRRGADINGMLDIEPAVFGLSPARAELLSPQFRMFLRSVHEALEDAGYPAEPEGSRIGVFAGSGVPVYLYPHLGLTAGERLSVGSANAADFLASRVAFTFGFSGPANTIQTACSTSLVSVNEACEALNSGRCEMAIAGGSSYAWMPGKGYNHERGLMYSPDGRCRVFDEKAGGTIFSSGSGAVLLKPYSAAVRDGDFIHAIIRGGAVNNDGNRRRGYASPSVEGQAQVIREAMVRAGVTADDISLVEAHGTGTQKGDPVELAGLTTAWRATSERVADCPLGSVKSNIGHADAAAGIAGLIKTVLALKHRVIPPTLNVDVPNPLLKLEESPFRLALEKEEWQIPANGNPRIAAVSAFGLGGTNAHTIVEEAPAPTRKHSPGPESLQILPFSSRTREGLEGLLAKWPGFLADNPDLSIPDAAFTLQQGRKEWKVRDFRIAGNARPLAAADFAPNGSNEASPKCLNRRPVFLFSGQGSQFPGMARSMWETDPVFQQAFTECARLLDNHLDVPLEDIVFADPDSPGCDRIHQTEYAQPALFAVCWAQSKRWQAWGIEPVAVLGHSIGEYVAATLAGVFSLREALALVAQRGKLMAESGLKSDPSGMTAVMATADQLKPFVETYPGIELAVINSPTQTVIAGPVESLASIELDLSEATIRFRRLKTSAGFHSQAMDKATVPFEAAFDTVELNPPTLPILSNLTGGWMTKEEATTPEYYAAHLRSTVRFEDNLSTLLEWSKIEKTSLLFLEMGAGNTLTSLVREAIAGTDHLAIATLPGTAQSGEAPHHTLTALGESWVAGLGLDWNNILPADSRRRIPLPRTFFVEQTCVSPDAFPTHMAKGNITVSDSSCPDTSIFHAPVWKQTLPEPDNRLVDASGIWLCFHGGFPRSFENRVASLLEKEQTGNIQVIAGIRYHKRSRYRYTIRPDVYQDYQRLVESVNADFSELAGMLHFWSGDASEKIQDSRDYRASKRDLARGLQSVAWVARLLGEKGTEGRPFPINVITRGLMPGEQTNPVPSNHALASSVAVIQREYPHFLTRTIELPRKWDPKFTSDISDHLCGRQHFDKLVFRDEKWWQPSFEPVELPDNDDHAFPVKDDSVCVVTGGLGGLARSIAKDLAEQCSGISLILLCRTALPPRTKWETVLKNPTGEDHEQIARIQDVQAMELSGAQVILKEVDITNPALLKLALEAIEKQCGAITHLFHTAGILQDAALATRDPQEIEKSFQTKAFPVYELANFFLANHARRSALNRMVLFSSISSDLAPPGQVDYAGTNGWLDGFAAAATAGDLPVLAVNWPVWRDVGMASHLLKGNRVSKALKQEIAGNSISPARGGKALMTLLACGRKFPRMIVSPRPHAERYLDQLKQRQPLISDSSTTDDTGSVTVQNPVETMVALWQAELKDPSLGPDDNYFDSGGDSVTAVRLLSMISRKFGQTLPMSLLLNASTAREVVTAMGLDKTGAQPSDTPEHPRNIIPLTGGSEGSTTPVFCFHAIDGGVIFYRELSESIGENRSVYAIESPLFHDVGEPSIPDSIESLARVYLAAVRRVAPTGPRIFCGYSFGGLVAYEAARIALEEGDEIESVVILDMFNPAAVRIMGTGERLQRHWQKSSRLPFSKRVVSLASRVSQLAGWMFRHTAVALGETLLPRSGIEKKNTLARKTYGHLIRSYDPKPLKCRTLLIVTENAWDKFEYPDDLRGWDGCLTGEVTVEYVGGNHLEIFSHPHFDKLVRSVNRFLSGRSAIALQHSRGVPRKNTQRAFESAGADRSVDR